MSSINLLCEIVALGFACLLLLVPYLLYFEVAVVPDWINYYWFGSYFAGFILFRIRQEIQISAQIARRPVFVDLSRRDEQGRVLLDSFWTLRDVERHWIGFRPGLELNVYSYGPKKAEEDLIRSSGVVEFDGDKRRWVLFLQQPAANRTDNT